MSEGSLELELRQVLNPHSRQRGLELSRNRERGVPRLGSRDAMPAERLEVLVGFSLAIAALSAIC